ncbi:HD domain-containing protein [Bacillus sp. FSL W7-1321]
MMLEDKLYGSMEVEPVLRDLVNSRPLQRLKGVHQAGAAYLVCPEWNVTRYEHSIGVMLLIRRLGGSLKEQAAGLLHDVSHTAFSHVSDYVFKNEKEDYHEQLFHKRIAESDIPAILKKHQVDVNEIINEIEKWPLLEQPAPHLCADRIDYTLRDLYAYRFISLQEAHRFLEQLIVKKGKMVVQSLDAAEWFIEAYYKETIEFFMEPRNVYANWKISEALRLALERGAINESDLLAEDEELVKKLNESGDEQVRRLLAEIYSGVCVKEATGAYDHYHKNKVRIVDPLIDVGGAFVPVSKCSRKAADLISKAREKAEKGIYLKVMHN